MNNVVFAEKELISTSRAAQLSEYSQDYIGQLCRAGSLVCKRISNQWYIKPDSLVSFAPLLKSQIPEYFEKFEKRNDEKTDNSDSVSDSYTKTEDDPKAYSVKIADVRTGAFTFDNREFVPTQKAAELSGYSQDYIGQLARSNEVPARKVGRRWFIDKEALRKHKNEKDAMLRALQSETSGIEDVDRTVQLEIKKSFPKSVLNYTNFNIEYEPDNASPLVPSPVAQLHYGSISGDEDKTPFSVKEDTLYIGTNRFRKRFADIVDRDSFHAAHNSSSVDSVKTANLGYGLVSKRTVRRFAPTPSPVIMQKSPLKIRTIVYAVFVAVFIAYATVLALPDSKVAKINNNVRQLASVVQSSSLVIGTKKSIELKYGDYIPGRTMYYNAD